MEKFYYPDDDPPRKTLRERLAEVRRSLARGSADASRGVRAEWRNLNSAYPWLVRQRKWILLGLAVVFVVFPALVWYAITGYKATRIPTGLVARTLVELPGQKFHPALSADGKRVAFVWDGGQPRGNYDIYIGSTAPGEKGNPPQRVTSDPANDLHPAFSPDGKRIAFIRNTPDRIQLMMITVDQHEETRLLEIDPKGWYLFAIDPLMNHVSPGPEWTADGYSVIVTDARNTETGVPLWKVDIISSEREQLTHPGDNAVDAAPLRMRSTSTLAFLRRTTGHAAEAFAVDASTGREQQLTSISYDLRGAALTANGRDLLVSSNEGGRQQIRFIDTRRQIATPMNLPGDYNYELAWDDKSLVWTTVKTSWSLAELPLNQGEPATGDQVVSKLASPPGRNHSPAFSPDGSELIWVSDAGDGLWALWKAGRGESAPRNVSRFDPAWGSRFLSAPAWSLDGRRVIYEARPRGNAGIGITDAAASSTHLIEENLYNEGRPTWSADGKWIYYSTDRDRTPRIWRRQMSGGLSVRVTSNEGRQAFESFDGKWLYFVPGSGVAGIWYMPANGGEEKVLPGTENYFVRGHWALGPTGIYFMGYDTDPRTVFYYSFETQVIHPVITLPRPLPADVPAMAVDREGTRLVFVQEDEYRSDLMIAQH